MTASLRGPGAATQRPVLVAGETCWLRARASRVAYLIDAAAYYSALATAIERAQHTIVLVGWDFHSRTRLRRDGGAQDEEGFLALLEREVRRKRRLRVLLLGWDFGPFHWLEREPFPRLRLHRWSHRRVRFHLDACHPVGASHHQKIAVIDDALAFCGGLDVTVCRWDTPQHAVGDGRRCDPGFPDYTPFHDVQMAVSGEAAAALGQLVRERWQCATGQRLRRRPGSFDPWPPELQPDLTDVEVGISRTQPAYGGAPEIREIEALYCRALRAAQHSVYIENQYLSSSVVRDVIAERLRDPSGPEFVIVTSRACTGWIEEAAMGTLRARWIAELESHDRFDRLRVYHARIAGAPPCPAGASPDPAADTPAAVPDCSFITIHSKVLVVDDELARIGSSNLSNRSLGLDTECDLTLEAQGEPRVAQSIASLRNRLLAEHLGCEPGDVERALHEHGSLIAAVESLRGGPRTLDPLPPPGREWIETLVPSEAFWDPEGPDAIESALELEKRPRAREAGNSHWWALLLPLLLLSLLSAVWIFTPLADALTPERIAASVEALRGTASGPLIALLGFVAVSLLAFPITLLCAAAALLFGWKLGFAIGLAGSLASALIAYAAGVFLWRDLVLRLAGPRLEGLQRALAERGLLAVMAVRVVPVAPFVVVNLVAGATRVRIRDFALGSALAMTPGILAIALFADRALSAWQHPSALPVVSALLAAGALLWSALVLRGWLRRRRTPQHGS